MQDDAAGNGGGRRAGAIYPAALFGRCVFCNDAIGDLGRGIAAKDPSAITVC